MKSTDSVISQQDTLDDADYEFLRRLVYERSRINLGADKHALVSGRVAKRLRALQMGTYHEYCQWLKSAAGAGELANLVDVISTNHTHFFREEKHFDWLRSVLLPQWRLCHNNGQTFRAWSAACSSGEEPYTLAIVLAEFFGSLDNWTIDATDISTRMLDRAGQAIYEAQKLAPVQPELRRRFFQRGVGLWEGHFRVRDQLRQRVRFQQLNLLQPDYPFAQGFHLIFCRNVMIYFDRPTQEILIEKLTGQLELGAHLVVGHSESLTGVRHALSQVQPSVYLKTGAPASY
ncbi:MAG: protein-glutamate O-methyltransferase CheR [Verrucomicrobiota bacterium]